MKQMNTVEAVKSRRLLFLLFFALTLLSVNAQKKGRTILRDGAIGISYTIHDPVCSIDAISYPTLDEALAAVQDNTPATITLLTDITDTTHVIIDNKKITFDLSKYDLQFAKGLELNSSDVDYLGKGKFTVVSDSDNALLAYNGSTCKLTGATCNADSTFTAISVSSAAIVTVFGNVTSQGTGVSSTGVSSYITVNGNITASGIGAYADDSGMVTVNGTITASTYINLSGRDMSVKEGIADPTNVGYVKYTDGASIVWVKMMTGFPTITTTSLPNGMVGAPYSQMLKATGSAPIIWSITDGVLPAGLALKDSTGEIYGTPIQAGTSHFIVTASNNIFPDALKSLYITIAQAQTTVTSVSISPDSVSVQKGNDQQFTATVTGTNKPAQTVKWSISGQDDAGTKISTSGLLTVAAGETATSLTVIATSTVDSGKSGKAVVTVTDAPTVTSVSVSPDSVSVQKSKTRQFTATVTGTNNPEQSVTWDLSGQNDDGTTISATGLLTVAAGETATSLTVIATSTLDTDKSGMAMVKVIDLDTGIDALQVDPLRAWAENGKLHVSGLMVGKQWSVYNTAGTLVHQAIAIGSKADTALPAHGVYIVRAGGKQLIIDN